MRSKLVRESLNEEAEKFEDLKVVETKLSSKEAQKILNEYKEDLPLFQQMVEKGMSKEDRNIELYFDDEEFIGYCIYTFNFFKFNKDKELIEDESEDKESSYKTLHINDIEIRDSIRKDSSNPRYGKMILNNILEKGKKYDGITLQANNEKLLKKVYPKYGFTDLEGGGNGMVKWN